MSKVKIEGNASGTGTLTISAPNTNTDRSLTLPDGAGEILTDASTLSSSNLSGALPAIDGSALTGINIGYGAFRATLNNQTISHATNTKIAFSSELSDYDNLYDTSNYRYQPDVAGLYYINSFVQINGWTGTTGVTNLKLYKNGSREYDFVYNLNTSEYPTIQISTMVGMNGTTDYLEIYVYQDSGGDHTIYGADWGQFEGYLVRAD